MEALRRARQVVALVVAPLILLTVAPSESAVAASTAPTVADVTTQHPRLIGGSAALDRLAAQRAADAVSDDLATRVVRNADAALAAPVVTYTKSDGARLLEVSRTVADRSYTLLVAWKLTGKDAYADRLWRDLHAAAAFPDWNPDHFLDTAEMTQAFAVAYDWGWSHWDSTQRAELRQAILDKGLTPALKVYACTSADDNPYGYMGNWAMRSDNVNLVVNSALATGALAVADDTESDLPQRILTSSYSSIHVGLKAYAADGGFAEGPTYWEYATRFLSTFLLSLRSATGQDFGLAGSAGLAKTAWFMQALTGPGGQFYGFADSAVRFQPAAAYAGLGAALSDPAAMAAGASARSSVWPALQLVFRDPTLAARSDGSTVPLENTFTTAGVTTMTGSRTDSRASYAAFRYGSNPSLPHQHRDAGDFGFQALGQEWASDLGMESGTYDLLAENRTSTRWNYYRTRAEGHNTLAIDPFDPTAGSDARATTMIRQGSDVDSAYAVADLTAAYPGEVTSWQRGIRLFDDRSQLLVQDEITAPGSFEALWSMHTAARIQVAADGRSAVLLQNGERVLARIVSPGPLTFTQLPAAPLPTSPVPAQTANDGIRKLAILISGSHSATVAVQLTPLRHGITTGSAPVAVAPVPLSTWATAAPAPRLTGITANGTSLSGFRADQSTYTVPVATDQPPVIAATAASGTVRVQQADAVPGRALITVTDGSGATARYAVEVEPSRLPIRGVAASEVGSGWASATFDGDPTTSWGTSTDGAMIRWELSTPAVIDTVVLSWRANSSKKVVFELSSSDDRLNWTQRYAGQYVGPSGDQAVKLSAGGSTRYLRLTVHGDGASVTTSTLDEAQLFGYDTRFEYPSAPGAQPTTVSLGGLPTAMVAGQAAKGTVTTAWSGTATATPTLWFASSNPEVATVAADGKITAMGTGTARIGVLSSAAGATVAGVRSVTVTDPTHVRVYAQADAYVQSSTPDTNYGTQYGMLAKPPGSTSPDRVAYLRFDLSALAGRSVTGAVLTTQSAITDSTPTPDVGRIHAPPATGSWTETAVDYANRPALGATVGSFPATRTQGPAEANLTPYVASFVKDGAGALTLGLTQDDAGYNARLTTIATRESGQPAYLDVTLAPPALGISSATASATTTGQPAATFDGDPSTSWSVDSTSAWLRWKLATAAHIGSIKLSWQANASRKTVFEVDTSTDAASWVRRYSGQHLGASGDQTVSLGTGAAAGYVRIVVHGDGGSVRTSTLREVRLLGYDATAPAPALPPNLIKSVAVPGAPLTLELGTTAKPAVTVTDSTGAVLKGTVLSFSSGNAAVASVDAGGTVTAAKTGTTALTVRSSANGLAATTTVPVQIVDSTRTRIYASADSYVESSNSGTNFGSQYGMLVKPSYGGSADRTGLVRFDLSSLAGRDISSAVLTTESVITDGTATPSTVRVDAHTVSGSWEESAVTYATRPTLGATVGSFVADRTKKSASADLTATVAAAARQSAGTMSLGLTEDGAGSGARLVTVSARESGKGAYLDITFAPTSAAASHR